MGHLHFTSACLGNGWWVGGVFKAVNKVNNE
jgi:hypothetical protein